LFATIAKYRLKLNPEKCVFGVEAGKFLGFMLTDRGIEANPDKCAAILAMKSPASVKEVHQLTGRMAALSRFVSAEETRAILTSNASSEIVGSYGPRSTRRHSSSSKSI